MFRSLGVMMLTGCLAMVAACAVDAPDPTDQASAGSWVADPAAATPAEPVAGVADDGVSQAVSCSIVQFCNAPGSDGTRCLQQGCSLGAAQDECSRESRSVCGTPVCPWVFVALDGTRYFNTSCP